jgi:hypothetical protein
MYVTLRVRIISETNADSVQDPLSSEYGTVTQQQIDLSAFMQKVWANFAENPSGGVGWPNVQL